MTPDVERLLDALRDHVPEPTNDENVMCSCGGWYREDIGFADTPSFADHVLAAAKPCCSSPTLGGRNHAATFHPDR